MNPRMRGRESALGQMKHIASAAGDLTEGSTKLPTENGSAVDTPVHRRDVDVGMAGLSDSCLNVSGDRTLAERAYAAIHGAIIAGEFESGDRLRIEELSATLAISPTPIREALNRLEAVGLAEHVPHRGSRVTDVSPEDLRELYEARLALEPLAVSKAAEQFAPETAKSARECLLRFDEAVRRNEFAEARRAHAAFHFLLYGASNSRWLVRLITPIWESSHRYRTRWKTLTDNALCCEGEHERILAACQAHQATTAATELYNHLARHANQIAVEMTGTEFFGLKDLPKAAIKPTA